MKDDIPCAEIELQKIVCTLGPASTTEEQISALFEAGADVFRLNFSHGTHQEHAERYASIRRIEREFVRPVGIMMDLQGPKIRVDTFQDGAVDLSTEAFSLLTAMYKSRGR